MTLYDILQSKLVLRKSGMRYVGQCPGCGGSHVTTRFVTQVGSDTGKCFSCGWAGDSVKYLREFERMKCRDAFAHLGRACDRNDCPVYDKCHGMVSARPNAATTVAVPEHHHKDPAPTAPRIPADQWQSAAEKLVTVCHGRLLQTPAALKYLAERGLDAGAVAKYRLGWLEKENNLNCIFRPRSSWGLSDLQDGQSGKTKKLWLPRGIVIPSFADRRIDRIRIRRPNGDLRDQHDPKYIAIEGGGNQVVSLNPIASAQIVVESDLDALLLDYLAGDCVGVIPLTTCTVKPWHYTGSAAAACAAAVIILVSLDSDPVKVNVHTGKAEAPGADNATKWLEHYQQAVRWPVPIGKDPGEAHQAGIDLRAWVLAGLPISLHPKVKAPAELVASVSLPGSTPVKMRVIEGREVYFPTTPEQWRKLVAEGRIVYGPTEAKVMRTQTFRCCRQGC